MTALDKVLDRTEEAVRAQEELERVRVEEAPEATGPDAERAYLDKTDREFRVEHEDEFLEPMNRLSEKTEPFSDLEDLVRRVNPDYETGEPYQSNCADCARCFERSWRGHVEEAAGKSYRIGESRSEKPGLYVDGEPNSMTEEWAGRDLSKVSPTEFHGKLLESGPGSSAIVHSWWEDSHGHGFGHAYNVVNDHGTIRVADAQSHEVLDFDDESIRPGISAQGLHKAIAWDAKGNPVEL